MKYRVWIGEVGADEDGGPISTGDSKPIKLSEYEVTGLKIKGFSDESSKDGISDLALTGFGKSRSISKPSDEGVKMHPKYAVDITCKIRSTVDQNTYLAALTTYGRAVGILPNDLAKDYKKVNKKNLKKLVKFENVFYGAEEIGKHRDAGRALLRTLGMSGADSAENCVNIKKWFDQYKVDEENVTPPEMTPNTGGSEGSEDSEEGDNPNASISKDVYRNVYIEVVLSDIQSFYYVFEDMYIRRFTESYIEDEGACTYTFELSQHYSKVNKNTYDIKKVTFGDVLSNGFKVLLDSINTPRTTALTSGGTFIGDRDSDSK